MEINSSKALAIGLVKASINLKGGSFNGWKAMDGNWLVEIERLGSSLASPIWPHFGAFCQLLLCKEKVLRLKSC